MAAAGSRDINVTPLIDVLLVLLVIFLLIMPVMLLTETVELPPRSDAPPDTISLVLKLEADLSVSIDDGPPFPGRELAARLRDPLVKAGAVFVDAVDNLRWGLVVSVIDTIRGVAGNVGHPTTVAILLRSE
jgi:biopolymer transport protein ExbD